MDSGICSAAPLTPEACRSPPVPDSVIHRDLKPANIKVRPDGAVKVLDFGLAKAMEPAGPAPGSGELRSMSPTVLSPAVMTSAGVILGTATYMSPEQARGKTVDRRADIWAFGVILVELLTGERVFSGDGISEIIAKIIEREPDRVQVSSGGGAQPAWNPKGGEIVYRNGDK